MQKLCQMFGDKSAPDVQGNEKRERESFVANKSARQNSRLARRLRKQLRNLMYRWESRRLLPRYLLLHTHFHRFDALATDHLVLMHLVTDRPTFPFYPSFSLVLLFYPKMSQFAASSTICLHHVGRIIIIG